YCLPPVLTIAYIEGFPLLLGCAAAWGDHLDRRQTRGHARLGIQGPETAGAKAQGGAGQDQGCGEAGGHDHHIPNLEHFPISVMRLSDRKML
ncbi:MAG: hypothetical protein B7Z13_04825, partial [Caulobacterales bacterium 32-67-6]